MSKRAGFTLIELLMVVVIIGILATIAVANVTQVREKAMINTVKTDLRNLAVYQERYFLKAYQYGTLADLTEFQQSAGVVITITNLAPSSWAAIGRHVGLTGPQQQCGVYIGFASAGMAPPATSESVVMCNQ